ncbi:hypothetical protein [Micromonospora sp. HUAS LYJ1]|uniref:hypothetical protein n=1 Tax=Micromonospora sp. HUAS LYJ1 TaxID=3061626 RepID=UPI002672F6B9|nr:hypothetical protein [Micromonospora sp. HUAS LYJ1]WKU03558.1 hypothetical protein Q2K16_22290 [Micromonospora sp. HUAS LYJ1]
MHTDNTAALVTGGAFGRGAATSPALAARGTQVPARALPTGAAPAPAEDGISTVPVTARQGQTGNGIHSSSKRRFESR